MDKVYFCVVPYGQRFANPCAIFTCEHDAEQYLLMSGKEFTEHATIAKVRMNLNKILEYPTDRDNLIRHEPWWRIPSVKIQL